MSQDWLMVSKQRAVSKFIKDHLLDDFISTCKKEGVEFKVLFAGRPSPDDYRIKRKLFKILRDSGWTPEEISVCMESYLSIAYRDLVNQLDE